MPELKHQHDWERKTEIIRQAEQRNQHDCEQLREKLESWQQQAGNRQNQQENQLKKDHDFYQKEWQEQSQQCQAQAEYKARYHLEKETIERFENIQQEQLKQLKQLEDLTAQQQQKQIQDLAERQSEQMAHCSNDQTQRQELEVLQQQERKNLEDQLQTERKSLNEYRDKLQLQMERDRGRLQEALYEEQVENARLDSLKELSARQERLQEVLNQQFSTFAQKAFAERFSVTLAIKELWENAAQGCQNSKEGFAKARESFWKSINEQKDENSRIVGKILEEAGYELQKGSNAPMLKMQGWDRKQSREDTDRRLTIDHADPQSNRREKTLDSSNLRFMTQRDNSVRSNKYNEYDRKP